MARRKSNNRRKPSAAQIAERKANKQALIDSIADGVEAICSSDGWQKMLRHMAVFYHYSFNNQCLIWMQMPSASRVAGYRTWQNRLHRQVRKGETGIKILTPRPFVKKTKDEHGNETEERGMSFGVASIFDISQTDVIEGKEDKAFQPQRSTDRLADMPSEDDALASLWRFGLTCDVSIEYGETGKAQGYFAPRERKIVLKQSASTGALFMILAHELAHCLHGHGGADDKTSTAVKELEAQSTAFVVCEAFGVDVSTMTFEYLAGWTGQGSRDALRTAGSRIQKVSSQLIEGIEALQAAEQQAAA